MVPTADSAHRAAPGRVVAVEEVFALWGRGAVGVLRAGAVSEWLAVRRIDLSPRALA